eukprot:2553237-Rhodomonas_salina.4
MRAEWNERDAYSKTDSEEQVNKDDFQVKLREFGEKAKGPLINAFAGCIIPPVLMLLRSAMSGADIVLLQPGAVAALAGLSPPPPPPPAPPYFVATPVEAIKVGLQTWPGTAAAICLRAWYAVPGTNEPYARHRSSGGSQ